MPILKWIGKDKVENHDKDLPFRVLKPIEKLSVGENNENLLIQGDNLEALKALMPFYYGKVKCVYIDPPYNTGNEGWIYNDKVNAPQIKSWLKKVVGPEGEDLCRHDKWLCMMYPRLKLLRDLLSDKGIIFLSIDDNEVGNLRMLMDEIFGGVNLIAQLVWKKKYTGGKHARHYVDLHEYILVYAKDKQNIGEIVIDRPENEKGKFIYEDEYVKERGKYYVRPLKSNLEARPTLIYPIQLPDGKEITTQWLVSKDTYKKFVSEGRILLKMKRDGEYQVYKKYYENDSEGKVKVPSLIDSFPNTEAKSELKAMFDIKEGRDNVFYTVKPTRLIKYLLRPMSGSNDIILDSFAGSGTTGQAVLELNKEDGGNRKFILVELEKEVAESVTAKRLKKVVEGYEGATYPEGAGQGFKYLDLNGELYDYSGYVNPDAKYDDMAAYIYFTETKNYLDISTINNPYIGKHKSTSYFLFFKEKDNNILDEKAFSKVLVYEGAKVVYADKCLIDEDTLIRQGVTFKQIPYELQKY